MSIKNIMLDAANARVHDKENQEAIKNSLKELGTGRSIIMDSENVIIGGNGVYEQAQELGLPIKIIESDGKELIAIRRNDLKTDDAKRKALAIADNKTSDLSFFDDDALAELISGIDCDNFIQATGFSQKEIDDLIAKFDSDVDDLGELPPENETQDNMKFILGEYSFKICQELYSKWIEDLHQEFGNDDESITEEIKQRLKLT